jgi:hypothetical protein
MKRNAAQADQAGGISPAGPPEGRMYTAEVSEAWRPSERKDQGRPSVIGCVKFLNPPGLSLPPWKWTEALLLSTQALR